MVRRASCGPVTHRSRQVRTGRAASWRTRVQLWPATAGGGPGVEVMEHETDRSAGICPPRLARAHRDVAQRPGRGRPGSDRFRGAGGLDAASGGHHGVRGRPGCDRRRGACGPAGAAERARSAAAGSGDPSGQEVPRRARRHGTAGAGGVLGRRGQGHRPAADPRRDLGRVAIQSHRGKRFRGARADAGRAAFPPRQTRPPRRRGRGAGSAHQHPGRREHPEGVHPAHGQHRGRSADVRGGAGRPQRRVHPAGAIARV